MGKNKKDRTEQLKDAAKRLLLAEQVQNAIEQHNFNRLVRQGIIIREKDK